MAELSPDKREELVRKYDVPCPRHSHHSLQSAPNEDMPNGNDYDFRCPSGFLYNASDVLENVLGGGA